MSAIYKSPDGERAVRERYLAFLEHWPVPSEHQRVPTRQGETFVIVSGSRNAPALVLLHGAAFNSVTWMGDVARWASCFRVYAVDIIGQAGLSAPSRPRYDTGDYACWLEDVLDALDVARAAIVGISLGGWLALDFATRRPDRVSSLVVLCPGGVGREKISTLKLFFVVLPLLALGEWGRRRAMARMLGPAPADPGPAAEAVGKFSALIFRHFRPSTVRAPRFDDDDLGKLRMPVLAIVGARDAMIDSEETKRRMEELVSDVEVRCLADTGHVIVGQTETIFRFLTDVEGESASPRALFELSG